MSLSASKIGYISLTTLQIFCQNELPAWKQEETQEIQITTITNGEKIRIFLLKLRQGKFHIYNKK